MRDKRSAPWWIWLVIIAIPLGAISECAQGDKKPAENKVVYWNEQDNSSMAFIKMQDFVKKRLKAPSTAKFPWNYRDDDTKILKEGTTYTVVSYVDAQNSFGAMLRKYYAGQIKQVSADNWELVELGFIDK